MRDANRFDAYDVHGGKYSARKVPKWRCNYHDVMELVSSLEDESALVTDFRASGSQ